MYIVSTPIGNLEDISFRALEVLKQSDIIASEDTRHSGLLLAHFGIKVKMISYYSEAGGNKIDYIIDLLKSGKTVSLISDAGTPCISDPGIILVSKVVEENIEVIPIPGASSLIQGIVLSGFDTKNFFFQGFLPVKKGRVKTLEELSLIKSLIVIFESKFRIEKTLKDCLEFLGNKEISLTREMTKLYEQSYRGRIKEILGGIKNIKLKGEFVIVINNR